MPSQAELSHECTCTSREPRTAPATAIPMTMKAHDESSLLYYPDVPTSIKMQCDTNRRAKFAGPQGFGSTPCG